MEGIILGTQSGREASYDATVHAVNTLALYLVVSGEVSKSYSTTYQALAVKTSQNLLSISEIRK